MAKLVKPKYAGVTQNADGSWMYRIKVKLADGKVVDTRIKKDKNNNPFLTAKSAHEAKKEHEARLKSSNTNKAKKEKYTLEDVYNNYLETKAKDKAPSTLKKQDSMWRNHVCKKFGDRDINSITIVELDSFLSDLYKKYSYKYVEGFLKFFYLLFGHADGMEVIDSVRYNRMFVTRSKRLTMPQMKQVDFEEDNGEPTIYSTYELSKMEKIFDSEDGNLKLAFYLGLYCGLRISECFGLRWSNVNWEARTIMVNRQLQYLDGELRLCPVKTLTSVRTIMIPTVLYEELEFQYSKQVHWQEKMGMSYRNTERVYDEVKEEWVIGGDFVNRKTNGELLTVNSMKYWSKRIKEEAHIDFKFHNLRHTYATACATKNVNMYMLMSMMGHKKFDTTKAYYIKSNNQIMQDATRELIEKLYDWSGGFNLTFGNNET